MSHNIHSLDPKLNLADNKRVRELPRWTISCLSDITPGQTSLNIHTASSKSSVFVSFFVVHSTENVFYLSGSEVGLKKMLLKALLPT